MNKEIQDYKKYITLFLIIGLLVYIVSNSNLIISAATKFFLIFSPFLIGIFLMYLLLPLVKSLNILLQKCKKLKNCSSTINILSASVIYLIVAVFITLSCFLCIPQLMNSIKDLYLILPSEIIKIVNFVEEWLYEKFNITVSIQDSALNAFTFDEILFNVFNSTKGFVNAFIDIVLGYLIAFYLTIYRADFKEKIKNILTFFINKMQYNILKKIYEDSVKIFNDYVGGKLLDSLIMGLLLAICLIIIKSPYIILLSIIFAITNMIPYFGPFIAEIFGVIILLPINFNLAFIYLIIALSLQIFDSYVLTPKILHSAMGLNPLLSLLTVLIGGKMFGFLGMLLGTPVIAIFLNIFDFWLKNKKNTQNNVQKY